MRYRVIFVLGGVFSAGLFVFLGGDEPRQAEALVMEEKQTRGFVERLTMVGGEGAAKSLAVGEGDALSGFSAWTGKYLAAGEAERAGLVGEGMKWAEARRPLFKEIIRENPREAIQSAVPMVVRQRLPSQILGLLEKRINDIGALRVFQGVPLNQEDPPVPTTREVELKSGGTYRAYVYGERANKLSWTPGAFVNGVAMDSEFAISDEPTRRLEVGERLPEGKTVVGDCPVSGKYVLEPEDVPAAVPETLAAVESPTEIITFCDGSHIAVHNQTILYGEGVTGGSMAFSGILPGSPTPAVGQVKVIVLNVTYADQNALPSTEADLYNVLRDVADHYSKASYGRLSLSGVVAPPIKLPHNEAWYVNRDSSNGGDIGGTGISMADARAEARKLGFDWNDYDCTVMRHNGGPGSYGGLGGGNTVWCRSNSISLWAHEIGHAFALGHSNFWDTAGTSSIGNGANQEYGDSYDIMGGAGTTGHYNAAAKTQIKWLPPSFQQPVTQSGLYRIHAFDEGALDASKRYALTIQKDVQRTYWGMVRSLFDSNPFMKSGLELGWKFPNGGGGNFQLIDTTNGSPFGKTDAAISLGATFGDTEHGIYMTTVAANDNPRYVDVQVNLGTFPGNHAPTMTLAASADVVPLNGSVTFTATANDVDGDPLTFNWQHFGSTAQIVSPNSNVITRQFTSAGTYIVTCTVSDMKGGTVTRNQLVTVGAVSTFTISGRVTLLGQGLSDVVITANNANGVISDADGYFTIPNLSANTYTLTPLLYGYSFGELFNNSITVGPSFSGADFEATAQSVVTITALNPNANELAPVTPGTFRFTRTGDISQDLVINVNSALGGATKGVVGPPATNDYYFTQDYVAGSQGYSTFTIPADSDVLDVTVTPVVDASSEGPETVILQLGPGNGYLVGSASSATVVIGDDDTALPKVSLTSTRNSVTENIVTPGLLTFSRTGSTAADLTVNYAVSGTATSVADFSALTGSVTILAGNASATVQITPADDSISESLETVITTLSTNAAYIIDPLATAITTTIYDDDLQTVNVTASDATATEIDLRVPAAAADTGTFLITRTGDTTSPLTIYYAFSGVTGSGVMALHGVDYEWMPGVVVIPAGQSSAAITIVPRFDGQGEGQERCVLNLGANATNYILGTSATATVNINDNPGDISYIDVVNTANGVEPSTNANFRFSLRGDGSDTPVAVNFALGGTAVNGTDYDTIGWWQPQSSGSTENLRAIWAANATNLWAVGDNGTILKGDGTSWTAQSSGTTEHLRSVWGTNATSVWAVGDNGVILFFNGTAWAAQTSGTTNAVRGVWGSSGTNVFAVGDGGTILRSTNGTSWAATISGTTNQLRAVRGADAINVYAVGVGGTVLKWSGSSWAAQTSGVTTQLNAVFAANTTNIWAVGNGGVVRKGNGSTWSSQTSANASDLNGVWAASTTNLLISGSSSAQMVSTNGTAWSNVNLSALGSFNGVFGTSSTLGWAVGDGGAIFKRDNATAIALPESIVIPRGASSLDLALRTKDDADLEDLETITLSITPSASYDTFSASSSATAWLRDNDNVNTLVLDTQVGTGGSITTSEGGTGVIKFYVSRIGSTTAAVTVNLSYSGTATMTDDYTAPASVTIPAGATGVDVPVVIVNDTLFEGTETIILSLNAGSYSRGVSATMYVSDNDTATGTIAFDAPSSSGLENVGTVNIPVTLSTAQASDVTVQYQTSGSTSATNSSFVPYWVRVVKIGNSVTFFQSDDGITWTQRGSAVTVSNLGSTSYLAGIAFAPGSTSQFTAVMDNFSVSGLSVGGSAGAETAASIGTVTGGSSVDSGVYSFTNSGNGLSNTTSDSFRYVYLPISNSANCTVTARLLSNSNVSSGSRAGVMLRSSTATNGVHASALGSGAAAGNYYTLYRTTTGGTATLSSSFTSLALPMWVRTVRVGNVFTQSISRDGITWTDFSTKPTIAFGTKVLAGLAVSAQSDGQLSAATFDNVTINGMPFTSQGGRTIGFVNEQGSDSVNVGLWTVTGSGAGIGGNDEAHFPSTEVSGDFTIVARVLSLTGGNTSAQAGVMVRDDRTHYARAVHTGWVKNNTVEQRYRLQSNTTAFGSGVDYLMPAGVLTIPAGQTSGNITLTVVNDTMDEADSLVTIQLLNASGANLGTNAYHGFTIIDDDNPPTNPYGGFATATISVVESAGAAQIAVALSAPAAAACSVDFATSDGTATQPGDYTTTTGTLSFAAGESVKYISVPVTDDAALETTENLTITLLNPVNTVLGSASIQNLTITDNDLPVITIVATDPTAGEAGLDEGEFTFYRTGDTSAELTVNYAVSGTASSATDRQGVSTSVTFQPGFNFARRLVIPLDDTVSEATETTILTISANAAYTVGSPSTATVNILDDDRSTVTITANDPTASEAAGNPGQFTVTRTAPTNVALTVNLTIAGTATNTTDYANVAATLAFANGDVSKTITITPVDDGNTEGPEDVTISLASGSYDIGAASFDNVSITDNDNPPTVFISSPNAQAPLVAATNGVIVSAQVIDDGFPAALSTTWSCVSGPGLATIESPNATTTAVTFSAPGTYVLRISATDTQFTVSDQTTVVVGNGLVASNWITQDLGPSSSRRGQSLEYGGLFSVTGTGAGYSATNSDQAQVMVRSATGDGSVVARITSFSTTAALAGVTIRDSLARGSNRAVLGFVPGTGLQFRTRTTVATNDTSVAATAPALPIWLKLERNATTNEISASYSSDGTAWTAVGTPVVMPLLNADAHYGLTTTNNSTSGTATALFNNVTLTPTPSGPALVNEDSGTAPNTTGSANFDGTTYTVNGPTTGYFHGWQYYGDMVITARLNTFSSGAGSSSGGIRIAESIEGGAQLHLGRMPTGSYSGYYWTSIAGGSNGGVPSGIAAGNWIRIVRRGNSVTGYRATHNTTTNNPNAWTQIGQPQTIIMTTPVWVGFFVNNASGAIGTQNTCTFTRLTIEAANKAPVVAATASGSITPISLDGTITDDSLPADFTSLWSQRYGPSTTTFGNAALADTTATITADGSYGLRITADDTGAVSFFDLNFNGYLTQWNAWQAAQFAGGSSNPDAAMQFDPDFDGVNNLLEYAFGTDPETSAPSNVVQDTATVASQDFLRLTVTKNPAAADVTYEVQATSNLTDANSWTSEGLVIEVDTGNELRVRDNVPISGVGTRFMRVVVTRL
ncbi:MAG: Calx-beta domain-containing protein [Verrucomicrobiaceae bacterium]|nr:Calx-beta domain-containing protein [Verrucomicrobiaceae bacterium]